MTTALEKRVIELERRLGAQDEEIRRLRLEKAGVDLQSANREMITGERANELLSGMGANVQAVRFGTKSFGKDASTVAARELSKATAMVDADMSDIIAGRPEAEALEVLKDVIGALPAGSLRSLDLSENALGEKGIRALEPALSALEKLEEIKFMNNGLSELSVDLLSNFLPTDNLRVLHFHNNMSGSGGAIAVASIIQKTPQLSDFRMSSSRVRSDGGLPMIQALSKSAGTLVKLNLSDSMFDEECTEALLASFPQLVNLTDLIVRDTGLDKDGLLKALADPSQLAKLAVLDISGLELEPEDGAAVGKILARRKRMHKIWLDDNELESDGVVGMCKVARKSPSMLELISVQTNQMGQRGAYALVQFALATPTMKRIELDDNQIGAVGVTKIEEMLDAQGKQSLIGSLEENRESDDEDEDLGEDDEDEMDDGDVDDLADQLGQTL